jgi:HEAT repeat protein
MDRRRAGGAAGGPGMTGMAHTSDGVPERRRRAVLAGFRGDGDFEAMLDDPDAAVRAAGFGALARAGRLDADGVVRALADPDVIVRRRGAALAGAALAATPGLAGVLGSALVGALDDPEPLVAEAAAWALGEAGAESDDAVGALCAVAAGHDDPLVRESAVAALGAIGAPRALDAVLGALDGPPALRRRAAVALAGFDDPRADEALRRCLADRDWQVRQVAEELLDDDGSVTT